MIVRNFFGFHGAGALIGFAFLLFNFPILQLFVTWLLGNDCSDRILAMLVLLVA